MDTEREVVIMVHTVIKGTKTIAEFKELKEKMEHLTEVYFNNHKSAWENWENGEPVKAWWDSDGNLCIEYENGKWWHYNEKGEWW